MLNLISDPWIPVLRKDGTRATIAPWQMADDGLAFPDWPRPDLNIACLELLVGLVRLVDPPADPDDWEARARPDPERLRARLAPFAPAFELMGDGPRFLQDPEPFEAGEKSPNPPDMLFIDSAGGQTQRNNADLMVRRGRYPALSPALAAIALYTLQAHAPAGGAGNRTSMRGGGPMVTLVDPGGGLWPLVWANVPEGRPARPEDLPWMGAPRSSARGEKLFPEAAHPAEALFGMPRRLRLVGREELVIGVVQKPNGTNYAGWEHPLTPHYRIKAGAELLPRHPRAGAFGYRNWLGVTLPRASQDDTARRAGVVELWQQRSRNPAQIIVAGWAMDNMKPRDFAFSRAPLIAPPADLMARIEGMVTAAEGLAVALRGALATVLAEGAAREAAREEFFLSTQGAFEARIAAMAGDPDAAARGWLEDLRGVALALFDRHALPGLADRDTKDQAAIVAARRNLTASFAGHGKIGGAAFIALGLPVPERRKERAA